MNKTQKVEKMIGLLTGNFSVDIEKIRTEIAPEMFELDNAIVKHYIFMISEKTQAKGPVIMKIITDVWTEMEKENSKADFEDREIQEAAEQYGKDPQAFRKIIDVVNELGIVGNRQAIGQLHVTATSRLKPEGSEIESGAGKIGSSSGSGKSTLAKTYLKVQVEGATFVRITDATEKSLYYLGDSLQNKCLFLEEAEKLKGDNGFGYAVRNLLSEDRLKKTVLENHYGNWFPVEYFVKGPISFLTTSIHEKLEQQFENRLFVIRPEVSSEHTNRVVASKFQRVAGEKSGVDPRIISAWQQHNLSLASYEVIIPFASKIFTPDQYLPEKAARAYGRIITAIASVALFYQKQRYIDESGKLHAELADYAIVYQLYQESLLEDIGLGSLESDPKFRVIRDVGKITLGELAKKLGISSEAASKWAKRRMAEGTLIWCDKDGAEFQKEASLTNAKHSGSAFLSLPYNPGLPSPYEVTGEPAWDKGGRLYELYNLHLERTEAFIDPRDPEPVGVRRFKHSDPDIDVTLDLECHELAVVSGPADT